MVRIYDLLFNEDQQIRFWQTLLLLVGINWKKCPPFRQIVRVNICCINSAVFFIATWVVFYCLVVGVFLGTIVGVSTVFGVKWYTFFPNENIDNNSNKIS